MSASAKLLSVDLLGELRAGLVRYAGGTRDGLDAAARDLQRTHEWIDERKRHWRHELMLRQAALKLAQAALTKCLAEATMKVSVTGALKCAPYVAAVELARKRVREAEEKLRLIARWDQKIAETEAEYERHARSLRMWLDVELPKASAFLESRIAALSGYTGTTSTHGSGSQAALAAAAARTDEPSSERSGTVAAPPAGSGAREGETENVDGAG